MVLEAAMPESAAARTVFPGCITPQAFPSKVPPQLSVP